MNLGISPRFNAPQQKVQQNGQSVKQNRDVAFGMNMVAYIEDITPALKSIFNSNTVEDKCAMVKFMNSVDDTLKRINKNLPEVFNSHVYRQVEKLKENKHFDAVWKKIYNTEPPTYQTPTENILKRLIPEYDAPETEIKLKFHDITGDEDFQMSGTTIDGETFKMPLVGKSSIVNGKGATRGLIDNTNELVEKTISKRLEPIKAEFDKLAKKEEQEHTDLVESQYKAVMARVKLG